MLLRASLVLTTVWLHEPGWRWLMGDSLLSAERLGVLVFFLALALLATRGDLRRWVGGGAAGAELGGTEPPAPLGPLFLLLVALAVGGLTSVFKVPGAVSGIGVGVAAWALMGLFLPGSRWRRSVPFALLVGLLLPMGGLADMTLGFPLRVATAELVAAGLEPLWQLGWLPAVARPDQLVAVDQPVEGGFARVDAPCAGVQSLWAGALLVSGATLLAGRGLDRRALAALTSIFLVLPALNALRVATLALLLALQLPGLADLVHRPLGVFAFVVSSGLSLYILGTSPGYPGPRPRPAGATRLPARLGALLVVVQVALALRPSAETEAGSVRLEFAPPEGWTTIRPSEAELRSALRGRETTGDDAGILKFRLPSSSGPAASVLILPSDDWRVHHLPSQCVHSEGLTPGAPQLVPLAPGWVVAEVATLKQGVVQGRLYWWYQALDRTTPELGARVWASWIGGPQTWVLVAVHHPQSTLPRDLLVDLHARVATALRAPLPPHLSEPTWPSSSSSSSSWVSSSSGPGTSPN